MEKTFATKLTAITASAAMAASLVPALAYGDDVGSEDALPAITTVETEPVVEVVSGVADVHAATTLMSQGVMNFQLDTATGTAALVGVNSAAEGELSVPETITHNSARYTVTALGQEMCGGGFRANPA